MEKHNRIYFSESVPRVEKGVSLYAFPENGILPARQVEKAREIVERHARNGRPYSLVTVSPYVLKAVGTYSDLLEQGGLVEYFGPGGKACSAQDAFAEMFLPFDRLMRGPAALQAELTTAEERAALDSAADFLADAWYDYDTGPAFEAASAAGIAMALIRDPGEQAAVEKASCGEIDLAGIARSKAKADYLAAKVVGLVAEAAAASAAVRKAWKL